MARSVHCECTYNFTCGYCLSNMKPWIWTPSKEHPMSTINGISEELQETKDELSRHQLDDWRGNPWGTCRECEVLENQIDVLKSILGG